VSYKRIDRKFQLCLQQARTRVDAVWTCVTVLCPDKSVAARRELAQAILNMSDGSAVEQNQRKITPAAVHELLDGYSQCVMKRLGKCPGMVFMPQLAEAINLYFSDQ
jgi:hypothetical protein